MERINQFVRNHRNFGISDLMKYIVITQGIVYVADAIMTNISLVSLLSLNMAYVLRGQVWRLVTFLIVPPQTSIIFIIFCPLFLLYSGVRSRSRMGYRFIQRLLSDRSGRVHPDGRDHRIRIEYLPQSLTFLCFCDPLPRFRIHALLCDPNEGQVSCDR